MTNWSCDMNADPRMYAKRLTDAGVPAAQAQVHAEILREALAAISLDRLEDKIDTGPAELNTKIDRTKAELEARMDRAISDLRQELLLEKIHKSKWSCVRWMIGIAVFVGTLQGAAIVLALRWLA
jgi:uncharacterized small protein (DUF1192 family)